MVGLAALLLVQLVVLAFHFKSSHATPPAPHAEVQPGVTVAAPAESDAQMYATYAGSESCRECHAEAFAQWQTSNHALAERPVSAAMDQKAFVPEHTFAHGTQTTQVGRDHGEFEVTSLGLSGRMEEHRVDRVIGNDPLRQFLVAAPGGRWQALEAAYDPHRNEWFNVFGNEDRQPGEWGHWTGRGMNWNSMCASCHNTRLRKNYDAPSDTYHTAMAEMTVGCESCHGPLRAHVDWQKQYGKSGKKDPTLATMTHAQMVDTCGACHARRTELTGDFQPGDSFSDHFDLTIVDQTDTYYPDGQVRDEDYEYASFRSSRMFTKGVYCLDCHQPHTMKTILPGNWLCLRCHNGSNTNAPVINPVTHSHHQVYGFDTNGQPTSVDLLKYNPKTIKETGGECVNCHMPQTVYMQRHWRHDHGFTIPDPLLTQEFNIPNACNRCHADKTTQWSRDALQKWYGNRMNRPTRTRAEWLARARQGDPAARAPLLNLLNGDESDYWKAVVTGLLGQWIGDEQVNAALRQNLQHTSPLVRATAVRALEPLLGQPDAPEAAAIRPLLQDPVRNVRLSAAWALRATLDPQTPAAAELQRYLAINADQPAGQLQLASYAYARGQLDQALAHVQTAVAWDSNSPPLRQELAVVLSALHRNPEAIAQLEAACRLAPHEAEYQFKLGLAWNEAGDLPKAIAALQEALRLNPRHARACYNLGLALNAAGQPDAAVRTLAQAETLTPDNPVIPYARATILYRQQKFNDARQAAERALALNPNYAPARQLLQRLANGP